MIWPQMDITNEERELILKGLSDDGKISKEAEKGLKARIEEAKAKEYPLGEVRRLFRAPMSAEDGYKLGKALDKLW